MGTVLNSENAFSELPSEVLAKMFSSLTEIPDMQKGMAHENGVMSIFCSKIPVSDENNYCKIMFAWRGLQGP